MNDEFEGALESVGGDGDDEAFQITREGVVQLSEWMRFTVQMCELEHGNLSDCDEPTHMVAFLLAFVIRPWQAWFEIDGIKEEDEPEDRPVEEA